MKHHLLQLGLTPIGQRWCPPTETYLTALERHMGAPLPSVYRHFLASFGACTFTDAVYFLMPDASCVDVINFLGNDPDDSYDLTESYLSLRNTPADDLLPVATCPLGNAFCLSLAPPFGAVRYIDIGGEGSSGVADCFGSFIAGLRRRILEPAHPPLKSPGAR